jgi:hypothetical protein
MQTILQSINQNSLATVLHNTVYIESHIEYDLEQVVFQQHLYSWWYNGLTNVIIVKT